MIRKFMLAAVMSVGLAGTALAGPQYVDETGFAVSGYDVVAYFSLEQAPVGQPQPKAVPGRADITTEWNGATWAFATEENRDLFLASPEKYAPAYDGHCAYGIAQGGKVPANPNLWRIVDDTLYLNITPNVVGFWEEDIPGQITSAETNWQDLETAEASTRKWTAIKANDGTYTSIAPITN